MHKYVIAPSERISLHFGVVRVVVLLLDDRVGAGDPQHDRGHQVFYGQEQQLAVQCPTTFGRAFFWLFFRMFFSCLLQFT